MYRTLEPDKIIKTLLELEERIAARFPGSGLGKVCAELTQVTRESEDRIVKMAQPNVMLRIGIFSVLALGLMLLFYLASIIEFKRDAENVYGVMQGIDSAFNIVLLMGAGMLFLASLEARWKRQKAMSHLHELRSIIHVIDMHQLPKDPSSTRPPTVATPVDGAPQRPITPFELTRYLDYCSEMLSLGSKVAALYAQSTKDPIVVDAASDLDQITTNLSSKIWQKITMAQSLAPQPSVLPIPAPRREVPAS